MTQQIQCSAEAELDPTKDADLLQRCTLGFLLDRVASLNDRILKKYLADECITLAQCKFILVLHERGSACLGELSGEILLDSGSTSRMLERLRRKGLLTVARSNYDRRKIQITFTSSGHLLAAKTPRLTANAVGEVIAALTEDEIRAFERTLQKVFLSKR